MLKVRTLVSLALALALLTNCSAAKVGVPLSDWERAEGGTDPEAPDAPPTDLTWSAVDSETDRLTIPQRGVVWLRAHATCSAWRDPIVFVPKSYVALTVWIGDTRYPSPMSYREASGVPWRTYPLPKDCDEVVVTFRAFSRYTQVGLPEIPRAGEHAAFMGALLPRDLERIVIAIVFLLVALVAALLAVGRRYRRPLAAIVLYGIGMGAWTLFHTKSKQLWFPHLSVWFAVWWVAVPMASTGVAGFAYAIFGSGPRRLHAVLAGGLAATSVAALLSLALGDAFDLVSAPIFVAGRGLAIFGIILLPISLGRRALRKDRDAAIFLAGLVVAFITVAHDFALSFHIVSGEETWAHLGYLGVLLAFVAIVRRRLLDMQRQIAEYAGSLDRLLREREVIVQDLHDGLGGIVTNVRMLAERGQRDGAPSALSAIARLAGDGIHELRTLVSGFDDLPDSWPRVAAELRRAGNTAFEPHEIAHSLEADLAADAPPPELATVLHLLRIHREATTNALKHAGASAVRVRLTVSADALTLEVADDGNGDDGAQALGVGRSKGLASMRARATALGGTLTISSESGTRVVLQAPLGVGGVVGRIGVANESSLDR